MHRRRRLLLIAALVLAGCTHPATRGADGAAPPVPAAGAGAAASAAPAAVAGVAGSPVPPAPAAPAGAVAVKLLTFNDFHGQLPAGKIVAGRAAGGAAVLAAHLRAAMAGREDRTILVEAGDLVGASPAASALLQDEPTVAFLNGLASERCAPPAPAGMPPREAVRRDALFDPRCNVVGVPGNHEFDEGVDELLRLLAGGDHPRGPFLDHPWRGARFPLLAANVRWRDGTPLFRPWAVKEAGGVRIGFIGAGLPGTPRAVNPAGVAALAFEDAVAAINAQVPALRALGVRALVAVVHDGGTQRAYAGPTRLDAQGVPEDLASLVRRLDPEIDVLVTGHTHSFTNALVRGAGGKPVLVVQAWSAGTAYADVDLTVDAASGDVTSASARVVTTWADAAGLRPDDATARLVAAAEARVAPLAARIVGRVAGVLSRSPDRAGESALGDVVAEAHRAAVKADFGVTNPGGLRSDLPASCRAPPCAVAWTDCFAAQPFSNKVLRLTLTGQDLLELLEQQWTGGGRRMLQVAGFSYAWSESAPRGRKVVPGSLRRSGGAPIDPRARYTLAVNEFLARGGDGFSLLARGTDPHVGPDDVEALVAWLEAQPSPVPPATDGRIRRRR